MRDPEGFDTADRPTITAVELETTILQDLEVVAESGPVTLMDFYQRWEDQHWSVGQLDFAQDARDWRELGSDLKERLLWVLTNFFHAEESVSQYLAPWVTSAPTDEMQIFLATQLADEARHKVFFDRFFSRVVGTSGATAKERLGSCHVLLNEAFDNLFYEMLATIANEVASRPKNLITFARGIAFYHAFLEGALGIPGQRYLLAFCRNHNILPAFRAGFTAVTRDESRHVGGGVRILNQLVSMDPDCISAIQDLVRDALPLGAEAFRPPNADFTYLTVLGYDVSELFRFALFSLEKWLRNAGVPFPKMRTIRLSSSFSDPVLEKRKPDPLQESLTAVRDQITPQVVFYGLPDLFDANASSGVHTEYQFDICGDQGGTWNVTVEPGKCEVREGVPQEPDCRIEMDEATWRAIAVGELSGTEAFLLGKVAIEGDLVLAMKFSELFHVKT